MKKRILSVILAVVMLLCSAPLSGFSDLNLFETKARAASFNEINQSDMFFTQNTSTTCTLCAAAMMMRRYARIRGDSNWSSITESAIRSTAWKEGAGLYWSFTYSNISVGHGSISASSSNDGFFINMLANHPEGVVVYNNSHAILLTDYTDGVFYCADPARSGGRKPISEAYKVTIANIVAYWYVTSERVYLTPDSAPSRSVLSIDKTEIHIGDSITFNSSSDAICDYFLTIVDADSDEIIISDNKPQLFTMSFQKAGHYAAHMSAHNSMGTAHSNWVEFYVYGDPPTKSTLTIDKNNLLLGDSVTFSNYADTYYARYYMSIFHNGEVVEEGWYPQSFSFEPTMTGEYSAHTSAYTVNGTVDSNWVVFTVLNGQDVAKIELLESPAKLSYTVGDSIDSTGLIICVTYNDGSMKEISSGFSCSPTILTSEGQQEIIVTYKNKTTSFKVSVNAESIHTHNYLSTITKQPSCESNGMQVFSCLCGDSYSEIIEKLGHDYSSVWTIDIPASCTQTGKKSRHCVRCDAKTDVTTIPAVGHSYGDWVITKSATCTADGSKTRTCSLCGNQEKQAITKLGHSFSSVWTIDTPASCTQSGKKSRHCVRCDAITDVITIPATGHSYGDWVITNPATCTADGSKARTCSVCGNQEVQTIVKLGHSFSTEWTIDTPASCTQSGSKSHHCTRCDAKTDVTTIPANGHSYGDWTVTTAVTCTVDGVKTRTCSVCGNTETQAITKIGHSFSSEWTIDTTASCTQSGSKSHHCTRCDAKTDVTTIPATGHSYGDWTVTTAATCTVDGVKTRTCSVCGNTETQTITKLGHSFSSVWTIDVPASCTQSGSKSHHCTRCDAKTDVTTIPATGHSYGDWVITKSATCTEDGVKKRTCSVCGNTETLAITKLDHFFAPEWTIDVPASCTQTGTKSRHCVRCDAITDVITIPATGHSYGDWVITNPATCTADGSKTRTCSLCGNQETENISAVGHAVRTLPGRAATCMATGLTQGQQCEVCGVILQKQEIIAMLPHDYIVVRTDSTCETAGEIVYTCSVCGDSYREMIPASGHSFEQWVITTPATEMSEGTETRTCAICGATETRSIPKLPPITTEPTTAEPTTAEPTTAEPITAEPTTVEPTTEPMDLPGDANHDGTVTAADARLILRVAARLEIETPYLLKIGDVDGNGKLTAVDARKILRVAAKLDQF